MMLSQRYIDTGAHFRRKNARNCAIITTASPNSAEPLKKLTLTIIDPNH